jgi:hypothetical protein
LNTEYNLANFISKTVLISLYLEGIVSFTGNGNEKRPIELLENPKARSPMWSESRYEERDGAWREPKRWSNGQSAAKPK